MMRWIISLVFLVVFATVGGSGSHPTFSLSAAFANSMPDDPTISETTTDDKERTSPEGIILSSSPRDSIHPGHLAGGILGVVSGVADILTLNPIRMVRGIHSLLTSPIAFHQAANKHTIIKYGGEDQAEPVLPVEPVNPVGTTDGKTSETHEVTTQESGAESMTHAALPVEPVNSSPKILEAETSTTINKELTEKEQSQKKDADSRIAVVKPETIENIPTASPVKQDFIARHVSADPKPADQSRLTSTGMSRREGDIQSADPGRAKSAKAARKPSEGRIKGIKPEKRELAGNGEGANKKTLSTAAGLFAKGLSMGDSKDYGEAIKLYSSCVDLLKRDPVVYFNRGVMYQLSKQYKEAIADYTQALAIAPHNPDAYYNRGMTHHILGEYEAAVKDYSAAIELNGKDADTYWNRGFVFADMGLNENAASDYCKAIDSDVKETRRTR